MFSVSRLVCILLGPLMLMTFGHAAAATPIIVTSAQYPYPLYSVVSPPNDNILVHGISIYEAYSSRVPGVTSTANILVDDQSQNSLLLFLSSYEPVNFAFSGSGVSSIKGVLLLGYNNNSVTGLNPSIVVNLSNNAFPSDNCYGGSPCSSTLAFASGFFNDNVDSFLSTYTANGFHILPSSSLTGGVPEPASWALMIVGFAGIGFAMRRRKGRALAAAKRSAASL